MSYLKQNLRYLRLAKNLNQEEFGAIFGLSRDNVASYERGIEPKLDVLSLIGKKLHIALDALINTDLAALPPRGMGEDAPLPNPAPVSTSPGEEAPAATEKERGRKAEKPEKKPAKSSSLLQVPVFNIGAPGGLENLTDNREEVVGYVFIPNMPPCDGAVYFTGESMYPLLKSGDMVLFQFTSDLDQGIFYGEMYLVSFIIGQQHFTTVKFIQQSALGTAYLKLVSQNQHFGPKDIPRSAVRALALVKASIRLNSM